jgi:transcriptional regulator of arginine metabolism
MIVVHTKAARHQRIVGLLAQTRVRSQGELAHLLAADGFAVTQATLSRDLDELGAVKVRDAHGTLCYAVPGEGGDPTPRPVPDEPGAVDALRRRCEDLLVSVDSSANIVILRTPPGGAQYLASTIDHTVLPDVIGTVAGDDTILLVTRDPCGGAEVAAQLLALADGPGPDADVHSAGAQDLVRPVAQPAAAGQGPQQPATVPEAARAQKQQGEAP